MRLTCRTNGRLFGEQGTTMAGEVCLFEYVFDVCDDGGWGNYLIAVL